MITLICNDALTALRGLPSASVHTVVTSPPYYKVRDYHTAGQIGQEATPAQYLAALCDVFDEVARVLRPDGSLWVNIGDSYRKRGKATEGFWGVKAGELYGVPFRLAFALQERGWYLRSDVIWAKPNCLPESAPNRPGRQHEYVFLLTRQPSAYYYDQEATREPVAVSTAARSRRAIGSAIKHAGGAPGQARHSMHAPRPNDPTRVTPAERNMRSVWTIANPGTSAGHFAVFPLELARRAIVSGASLYGVCGHCGTPYRRQVTKEFIPQPGERIVAGVDGQKDTSGVNGRAGTPRGVVMTHTAGWEAGCTCGAAVVAARVLDPFAGAGTVGLVAEQLGLDSTLIEISPDYVSIIQDRITEAFGPLFGGVIP